MLSGLEPFHDVTRVSHSSRVLAPTARSETKIMLLMLDRARDRNSGRDPRQHTYIQKNKPGREKTNAQSAKPFTRPAN